MREMSDSFSRQGNKVSQRLRDSDSSRVIGLQRGGAWIPTQACLTADPPSAWDHPGTLAPPTRAKCHMSGQEPVHSGWPGFSWGGAAYISDSVLILRTCSSLQLCLQSRIRRGRKPLFRNGPLRENHAGGLQPKRECCSLFPGCLVS